MILSKEALHCTEPAYQVWYHSYCGSGNIKYLVCHVTLLDHVIKRSSDLLEGRSSLNVSILPGFTMVTTGIVIIEKMFLIYHVASCDHVLKGLCKFVGGSLF